MKLLFLLLLLAGLSGTVSASDKPRDWNWVLEQYERKELYPADRGRIDGVEYLAFQVGDDPGNPYSSASFILVFRKMPDRSALVATIDLQGDYPQDYEVTIKNNSVYLKQGGAHHGVYSSRYQFKQIERQFRMIGEEWQSIALGCYSGDESPGCDKYVIWLGGSYNLLTASAISWKKKEFLSQQDDKKNEEEMRRFNNFLWPKDAVAHQRTFRPVKLPLLDGFDFDNSVPEFNYKNKLKKPRQSAGN